MDKKLAQQWKTLTGSTHTEQGIWFLNGFWDEAGAQAEDIWTYVHLMIEIECGKPKLYGSKKWEEPEGNDLDQFQSHRFMEKIDETVTVKELRARLKKIDIDNNNKLCLTEYLIYKYSKDAASVCNSPQGGGDPDEFLAAQEMFNKALAASQAANQAQTEANAAVQALEQEEMTYNNKIKKQEDRINDSSLSQTKRMSATNKLAQLKAEDPLPLRKAKITSKAALKKCKKAAKEAKKVKDTAKEAFDEMKKKGGAALGAIWWMERELEETEKFSPKKRKKK